jgi:hypothetical protein
MSMGAEFAAKDVVTGGTQYDRVSGTQYDRVSLSSSNEEEGPYPTVVPHW